MQRLFAKTTAFLFLAVLTSSMLLSQTTTPVAHKDRKHMHVKNWMTQPTGASGVLPLDPSSVPKFVNQLSRPPVFIPIGTKFEKSLGRNVPLYEVTENIIF